MVSIQENIRRTESRRYKLVPPDGGWGYCITASVTVMSLVSIVPQTPFGLIFGNFLASVGDEATGTTIANGVFNTVQSFTGLATSYLLQKYSYRKVGLLGATLFSIGAFAIIFMTDLTQMILFFGILQGLGYGLMTPASFSAFNCYFDKKLNLMMSIAQAIMVSAAIAFPPVMALSMEYCGFRGTVAILAALSLLNFLAMAVLQPVKWHMKKIPIDEPINDDEEMLHDIKSKSLNEEVLSSQIKPLLVGRLEEGTLIDDKNLSTNSLSEIRENIGSKPRFSVISLDGRVASLTVLNNLEDTNNIPKPTTKCMDLSFLKDFKYLNISIGVSLSFTSDVAFIALIPLILSNAGFGSTDIALMMMVYFTADLVSRVLLSILSALCAIRNRYIFLTGTFLSAIFRIAFVMGDAYMWKMATLASLGFLRCLIQTPLSLVFSEEYYGDFPTAFSLYMAVCGCISIIVGLLMSTVKSITQNDVMVVHVLTGAFLISSISWMIELAWNKMGARKVTSR